MTEALQAPPEAANEQLAATTLHQIGDLATRNAVLADESLTRMGPGEDPFEQYANVSVHNSEEGIVTVEVDERGGDVAVPYKGIKVDAEGNSDVTLGVKNPDGSISFEKEEDPEFKAGILRKAAEDVAVAHDLRPSTTPRKKSALDPNNQFGRQ